ncbi:MAG TPA: acyl-CoA dehydrogenase [Thermoleophilaceae bacterium]|nr:acyl-CoA dehydrogenase [Thermoleophilaceae bacterium]
MATTAETQDAQALGRFLDGPHAEVRDEVREWLSREGNAPRSDLAMPEHREQVLEWIEDLASTDRTTMGYPVEYGGRGDLGGYISGFETMAFGDLSLLVKCGVQFGLWGGAVQHLGTEHHHEKYLEATAKMELPGCFAMTELGHGSNVQDLRTTATYDPDAQEFVVHTPDDFARKEWIGNAARDGVVAAVFCQLIVGGEERGVHALVVPIRDEHGQPLPGVRIEDIGPKLGLDGVDNGRLWFDQVRVPRENLLDRYATVSPEGGYTSPIEKPTKRFFTMLGTLIQGRVSVCGAAINASKVALTIAVRHALTRKQFGPPGGEEVPLMTYRTHRRRLLIPLAENYALHFAQERLVAGLVEVFGEGETDDETRRELETMAAALKAVGTWHATSTIQGCREACGGQGYLKTNRFAALKADTDVFTTFEGDNTVLLQLAAKNLLTDFQHEFSELDPFGTFAFVAEQVAGTVAERTAVRELLGRIADDVLPGRDDEGDLLERETQLEFFRWREHHVKSAAARRLKGGMDAGMDPFEVLNDCQDHVVLVGRVYAERVIMEAFADAVERCPEPGLQPVLARLCDLYALSRVEADRGWFQEHGKLSSTRSKAVLKGVNTACDELAEHAELFVEAYGVPEAALGDAHAIQGV